MSKRWAILVVAIAGGYQSGAAAATEIVYGYPSQEEADEAAKLIHVATGSRTAAFPYFGNDEQRSSPFSEAEIARIRHFFSMR